VPEKPLEKEAFLFLLQHLSLASNIELI
jgi:hypothetical protein